MKLSGAQARAWLAKPDAASAGALLYGQDAMRVALQRQAVVKALLGPNGESEMRLTRMQGAECRKDPAMVIDGLKAQVFFPGPRVVLVEDVSEAQADVINAALGEWQDGDAQLIVTAGALRKGSKLINAFTNHPKAVVVAIYADPPSRDEIMQKLTTAGVSKVDPEAMKALDALARSLDPGELIQTIEKLSLYKNGDAGPVTENYLSAITPASVEAGLDDVLNTVTEAQSDAVGPLVRRLRAQGVQPVGVMIAAMRHFRMLYTAAAHPGGVSSGVAALRPPVFGPRRDRMQRQAQGWGAMKLEQALGILTETDLTLRSAGQNAPSMALVERALIRLSMLARSRH